MADTKNTTPPPASEPAAGVEYTAPASAPAASGKGRAWLTPLVVTLGLVGALGIGGVGGFAIAAATLPHGPAAVEGALPGGPQGAEEGDLDGDGDHEGRPGQGEGRPGQGEGRPGGDMQGPGGQGGERPAPGDQPAPPSDGTTDDAQN